MIVDSTTTGDSSASTTIEKKTVKTDLQRTNFKVKEPLTNSQNLSYIGELYLGSPNPQKVRAIFDTGSANPWILSREAAESMDMSMEIHPYDHEISETYKEPND